MEKTILCIENDQNFLDTYAELLTLHGFRVLKASDLAKAEELLNSNAVHLAIVDLRLTEDNDSDDQSGLQFLQNNQHRYLPKIVLTAHPSLETTRASLRFNEQGQSPAVDYLDKRYAYNELISSVMDALGRRINFDLDIQLKADSFMELARKLAADTSGLEKYHAKVNPVDEEQLQMYADELETLVRRAFREEATILVDIELLPEQFSAIAWVTPVRDSIKADRRLMKLGTASWLHAELAGYKWTEKNYPVRSSLCLEIDPPIESAHFGSFLSTRSGSAIATKSQRFKEYYTLHSSQEISEMIEDLFERAQENLYSQECPPRQDTSLQTIYKTRLGYNSNIEQQRQMFEDILHRLERQRLIKRNAQDIIFDVANSTKVITPNPVDYLLSKGERAEVLQLMSIGAIDPSHLLVDNKDSAWVTEFGAFGPAPCMFDFTALEAKIHLEWLSSSQLTPTLRDCEMQLCAKDSFGDDLSLERVSDAALRKAVAAIAQVRLAARATGGFDEIAYIWGLLLHAGRFLMTNASLEIRQRALFIAGLLCKALE